MKYTAPTRRGSRNTTIGIEDGPGPRVRHREEHDERARVAMHGGDAD